jgi:hypothetical protein
MYVMGHYTDAPEDDLLGLTSKEALLEEEALSLLAYNTPTKPSCSTNGSTAKRARNIQLQSAKRMTTLYVAYSSSSLFMLAS